MRAHERLLRYIQFDTASDDANKACPSSAGQKVLGAALVDEMKNMGIADARMDEHGYVYGSVPANADGPCIGLIAHMDTVSDLPVLPMNARVIERYDGGDVRLSEAETLSVQVFPFLAKYAGQSLIVTDGRTILGADDKAGVAEILTACERLIADPAIRHGRVAIAFTPDEEIGRGADRFDVAGFGAQFAYTVDGGELGGIEYENFNAASATVCVRGVNIHPGTAKGKMKNAILMLNELINLLPAGQTPAATEGYEGFFHATHISGSVERAELKLIIRDHDEAKFEARKQLLREVVGRLNARYGAGTLDLQMEDSYYNMKRMFEGKMFIVERAQRAMRACGVQPYIEAIRGGTDGARLSFMGLPCPNLSTGGMNYHGRHECIPVQSMDKMVDVLVELVRA